MVKIFWQTGQENIGCGWARSWAIVVTPPRVGPRERVGVVGLLLEHVIELEQGVEHPGRRGRGGGEDADSAFSKTEI